MNTNLFPSPQLIGQLRTLGAFGPPYRILGSIKPTQDGDWLLKIQLVETGEETEYSYTHVLNDPKV